MKPIYQLGLAASGLLLFMAKNAFTSKRRSHTIEIAAKRPFHPFDLLFIADVHRRRLPDALMKERADAVLIGGDLLEEGVPLGRVEENLRKLSAIGPVYFVWGNNDRDGDTEALEQLFTSFGVEVLSDRAAEVAGNRHVKLVGNDYFAYKADGLEQSFSAVGPDDTVIFATHTPFIFDKVKALYAPDVLLAGHTHGGQIRVGPIGIYEKGSLRKNGKFFELITNGFGTTHLHLRLGTRGEYHMLHMRPKPDKCGEAAKNEENVFHEGDKKRSQE